MKIISPTAGLTFNISDEPVWPSMVFKTDAAGKHTWKWTLSWKTYTLTGSAVTEDNTWDAKSGVVNFGGTLRVEVTAGADKAALSVKITGTNPTKAQVIAHLGNNSLGYDKLLEHESHFRNFNAEGEPIKSFDNGYGMSQLTHPAPTFDQIWNWKHNVSAGFAFFKDVKLAAAKSYLSKNTRTYTDEQLMYEAVCRYNGGAYHVWDSKRGAWIRNPNMLCDSKTGNIGWDMTDATNKGKTESQLHKRDQIGYSHAPSGSCHWKYSGVCYADAILGAPAQKPQPAPPLKSQPKPPICAWLNEAGQTVHPHAPAGAGGLGFFRFQDALCAAVLSAEGLAHPFSPAARMLDQLKRVCDPYAP